MRNKLIVITLLLAISLLICSCGGSTRGEIKSDPENSFSHHYYLGIASFEKKQFNEAVRHFKRSISLNPNIARTHNELGMTYLQLGQYANAVDAFEKALALDTRLIETHNNLGVAYLLLKEYDNAETHFQAVLNSRDYGTPFIPLYNLGNLYQQKGDLETALAFYNNALEDEQKVTQDYRLFIHLQIGNIQFDRGKFDKAFGEYEKVLILNPRLIDAVFKSAVCAYNLGDKQKSIQMFNKVISIDPRSQYAEEAKAYLRKLD